MTTSPQTAWLPRHWLTLLAASFIVIQGVPFFLKPAQDSEWEEVYVAAGQRLAAGDDLYPQGTSYLYPPFGAFCAMPFTWLAPAPARLAWYAVNMLALIVLCWTA